MICKNCGCSDNPDNASKCGKCGEKLHDNDIESELELFEIGLRKKIVLNSLTDNRITLNEKTISEKLECDERSALQYAITISFLDGKWQIKTDGGCKCFIGPLSLSSNDHHQLSDKTFLRIEDDLTIWAFAIRIKEKPIEKTKCPSCGLTEVINGKCSYCGYERR